jgi:replicative DNA helicase
MADDSISKLRLPPHSLEAEQSLLGGLLIDNEALDKVADIVSVKDFYRQDHQIIYQHIHRLIERSQPADIVTVGESLESNSELNTVGGLEYLGLLAESTPTAANIRGYAQIIRERSIMRSLVGKNDRIGFTDIKELLPQVAERIDQLFQRDNPSDVTGIPTGYKDLDMMTSGLQPGDLIIIAGRPSMGKTSLALNICEYVAIDTGLPSAVFSMEMGSTQLVSRLIGSVGKLNQHKMRTGQLDDNDWEKLSYALGQLNEAPIFIDEGSALNPYEVRARARRLHKQCGRLGLIVIDYLQLMGSAGSTENRATEISEISRSLKALAKELNVPVIALSQLNRSVEQRPDKRPVMSDLRESGAIEQDADVIMFIYRDEVYNPETPDKGIAEIILAKQRNGPVGRVKLTFLGEYTKFENYANPVGYDIPD